MGETAMRLALLTTIDRPRIWRPSTSRVHLSEGDVYRIPRHVRRVRVVSGQAWVSFAGQDILLAPGQQMAFAPEASNPDIALISCIDQAPLIFETTRK